MHTVKILSPLTEVSETEPLIAAGADEFYCGVVTDTWRCRCSSLASNNARETGPCSLKSYDELTEAVTIGRDHEVNIAVAVNRFFVPSQYPLLHEHLDHINQCGAAAIIVGDMNVLAHFKDFPLKKYISVQAATLNPRAISFYREFGASRVILPRHLTIKEIVFMIQQAQLDCEVFALGGPEPNIEGNCGFQHGIESYASPLITKCLFALKGWLPVRRLWQSAPQRVRAAMMRSASISGFSPCMGYDGVEAVNRFGGRAVSPDELAARGRYLAGLFHDSSIAKIRCVICFLPELMAAGVRYLKIDGREYPISRKLQDVRFLREALTVCGTSTPEEFRGLSEELLKKHYGVGCKTFGCFFQADGNHTK